MPKLGSEFQRDVCSVFCSEAFWKLKTKKFKNLFICKCAFVKFSVVHLNHILLFVFPDCQVSILKNEVDGKGRRNCLCKLVHINVPFAMSVLSSIISRPFNEVQFCIFYRWIFFFFSLFSPSIFSMLLVFLQRVWFWPCMSLLYHFTGTVLFLLLVLSCSKFILQRYSSWLTDLLHFVVGDA